MTDPTPRHDQTDGSPLDDTTLQAFADGELRGDAVGAVIDALASDPGTASRLRDLRRLKAACHRAALRDAPACPDDLRAAVQRLVVQPGASAPDATASTTAQPPVTEMGTGPVSDTRDRPAVLAQVGFWGPLAAAALLAFGVFIGIASQRLGNPTDPLGGASQSAAEIVPVAVVRNMTDRHISCSADLDALMSDDSLPNDIQTLPAALTERYGGLAQRIGGVTGLDLTAAGYTFAGVGPCTIPGRDSVHLVYHAAPNSGHDDSVSLWVRPVSDDTPPLAEGRVHMIKQTDCAPVFVWREGELLYLLAADDTDRDHAAQAVEAMTGQVI